MIANGLMTIAKTIVTNSGDKQPHLRCQARLAIIPNAPHLANLEQPDTFNHIVAAFTSELGKGKQT
jgi:pimeloyl-ACP methyl ester carboxylesterase